MASEEMLFENVDGRTTDAWLYYLKLAYEFGSCELKIKLIPVRIVSSMNENFPCQDCL